MNAQKPYVSIGLPVFNGENYLEETLQSILAQTFSDFELIISDNASTDRTQEICETYARQDRRIRYTRHQTNLGAGPNFNRTVELSRGKYFKWAAHDDLLAPDYLEKCVAALDNDPSILLCHTKTKLINGAGEFIRNDDLLLPNAGSLKPQERFADLILIPHLCFDVFGLIRAETLKRTPLIGSYIASDEVLLGELALYGRFHQIDEYLFFARRHPEQSIEVPVRSRTTWFDTKQKDGKAFPYWRLWYEHYQNLKRVPLNKAEKMACYLQLMRYPNKTAALMAKDLIYAISPSYLDSLEQTTPLWYRGLRKVRRTLFLVRY